MNNRRAQAAMEFLMTYGWALLVVIIVIAALAFFGLLNPSRFLPEKCEIAPGISCVDFSASALTPAAATNTSTISMLINNGVGTTINVMQINISGCNILGGSMAGMVGTVPPFPGGLTIAEATTQNFTIANCSNMVKNSRFRSDIIFTYNTTVEGTTVVHVKKGYLVVQVQ